MSRSDEDTREDFEGVYDFKVVFASTRSRVRRRARHDRGWKIAILAVSRSPSSPSPTTCAPSSCPPRALLMAYVLNLARLPGTAIRSTGGLHRRRLPHHHGAVAAVAFLAVPARCTRPATSSANVHGRASEFQKTDQRLEPTLIKTLGEERAAGDHQSWKTRLAEFQERTSRDERAPGRRRRLLHDRRLGQGALVFSFLALCRSISSFPQNLNPCGQLHALVRARTGRRRCRPSGASTAPTCVLPRPADDCLLKA